MEKGQADGAERIPVVGYEGSELWGGFERKSDRPDSFQSADLVEEEVLEDWQNPWLQLNQMEKWATKRLIRKYQRMLENEASLPAVGETQTGCYLQWTAGSMLE